MAYITKPVLKNEVIVNVQVINHFTWFDKASCRGRDLFPLYQSYIYEGSAGGGTD